jgi:hypothetical protein
MKRCATCGEMKEDTEFNWRYKKRGIRHPTCRRCHKVYRKNWYENNKEEHQANVHERLKRVRKESREFVWDYLSTHPCVECGEDDPIVLEFHHVKGKDKSISQMAGQGYSIESLIKEIGRCVVLCANCHRRLTAKERGWYIGGEDK